MPGRVTHAARGAALAVVALSTLLATLLVLVASHPPAGAADPRPNVVVIMTDDQRMGDLAYMPQVRQSIGAKGATFDRSYIPYSLCCPSRATYLTGQYSHNNGVRANGKLADGTPGGYYALNSARTLPVWMHNAGYTTGHIGKYLNRYGTKDPTEVPPGWDEWDSSPGEDTYKMYDYTMNQDGTLNHFGTADSDYRTTVEGRIARQFIATNAVKPEPFFLSLAPLPPHDDLDNHAESSHGTTPAPGDAGTFSDLRLPRPPSFNEKNNSDKPKHVRAKPRFSRAGIRKLTAAYRRRLESLLGVDDMVRSIVSELALVGQLDNTYIIFTSDNGWMLGEHRLAYGKVVPYEESIHVPLMIRGPGIPQGVHRRQFVANFDLAPTITSIGHATPTRTLDGMSFLPFAQHNTPRNRAILMETYYPISQHYKGLRFGNWMYAKYQDGERELYNLRTDPYELRNKARSRSYRGRIRKLDRFLKKIKGCKGSACRRRPPSI